MGILGLDNGIYVKSNKRKITREMLPSSIIYPFEKDYSGNVEIVYWRKCWGMRNEVMNSFGWHSSDPEQYIFDIDTHEQVLRLIEIIASWINEDRWNEEADSIWDYDEMREILIQNIVNLSMIYIFMATNPDIYLEFYDSY